MTVLLSTLFAGQAVLPPLPPRGGVVLMRHSPLICQFRIGRSYAPSTPENTAYSRTSFVWRTVPD